MTPDAPPRPEPYQVQDTARMKVRGRALNSLAEDTVIIRCNEHGDVDPDGSPIVLRGPRPSAPPDAHFLVIWAPVLTPDVHPTAEIPVDEGLRLCEAYTAVPRASCVAHSLARAVKRLRAVERELLAEVTRLRAELTEEKNFGLHLNEGLDAAEEEKARLVAVTVEQYTELIKLRKLATAARAFNRPLSVSIHSESPAVVGLVAALRSIEADHG
jgi:hypothetical protein